MTKDDFSALENMVYSGRGIMAGMTSNGHSFIGYSLTGRSTSSQARELIYDEARGVIRTSVTDPEQLAKGSPALLIYPAVAHYKGGTLVASNGAQTKLLYSSAVNSDGQRSPGQIISSLSKGLWEYDAKEGWIDITSFEPDAPNSTPRISVALKEEETVIHVVRKGLGDVSEPRAHRFVLMPFEGKLITTYKGGNEKPLAPFDGQPLDVKVWSDSADEIVDSIYNAIGPKGSENYRVAAAVMMLTENGKVDVAIRNRSQIGN